MFLADLLKALRRRWYLAVIGLIATAALMGLTYEKAPPSYTATAEVLLLPPATSVPEGGNPYLNLGGLDVAGDILAKAMSSDTTANELKAAGVVGEFRVGLDSAAAAPLILVTAEAPSSAASMHTLGLVVGRIPGVLADVQILAKVPQNAFITSTVITRSDQPVRSLKPVVRAVGIAGAGGLALTMLATALIDAFLIRGRAVADVPKPVDLPTSAGAAPAKATRRSRGTLARQGDGLDEDEATAPEPESIDDRSSSLAPTSR